MNETVAVIGLGTMGLGIAQVYAQSGLRVLATDAVAGARATAVDRLNAGLAPRVAAGKLAAADAAAIAARVQVVDGLDGLDGAALVIEAVAEDLAVKQALFRAVERAVSGRHQLDQPHHRCGVEEMKSDQQVGSRQRITDGPY